jgi:hypothetical protein
MTEQHFLKGERGLRFEADDEGFLAAIDAAVDYRGDVTLARRAGEETLTGYIFDFAHRDDPERAVVRVLPAGGERQSIPLRDIAAIEFTGRDTAEGKSFETWMKKYVQKKLAGEQASIESEPLE